MENSSRDGNIRPPYPPPEKSVSGQEAMVRSRHEQLIGPKLGKEYDEAVYCHPVYLTYMQRISCEMLGWMNHKLE